MIVNSSKFTIRRLGFFNSSCQTTSTGPNPSLIETFLQSLMTNTILTKRSLICPACRWVMRSCHHFDSKDSSSFVYPFVSFSLWFILLCSWVLCLNFVMGCVFKSIIFISYFSFPLPRRKIMWLKLWFAIRTGITVFCNSRWSLKMEKIH